MPDEIDPIATLAAAYDAKTLLRALVARLTLDGQKEAGDAVLTCAEPLIDPGPGSPH